MHQDEWQLSVSKGSDLQSKKYNTITFKETATHRIFYLQFTARQQVVLLQLQIDCE